MRRLNIILGLLFICNLAYGAMFTSSDGQFSLDMPTGWKAQISQDADSVLFIIKGMSKIEFKKVPDCKKESCIEQKINEDVIDVKSKNMKVLANPFTEEEVKKVEFATGEPFLYMNFSGPKTDFSAGYFLVNSQAYSVFAQNISYAEADLYFSFISPKIASTANAYDTYALPTVEQKDILPGMQTFKTAAQTPATALPANGADTAATPVQQSTAKTAILNKAAKIKKVLLDHKDFSFVSKNMPPFIVRLGRIFDAIIVVVLFYALAMLFTLFLKFFIKGGAPQIPVNPASSYPVKCKRLYGTPSLIFQAKDNQGNAFISFNTRWGNTFEFAGAMFFTVCVFVMCALSVNETFDFIKLAQFHYNTAYSICSLILAVGVFMFALGALLTLVSLREFNFYNKNGKKSVYVLQKGYGLKKEVYTVYFAHTKETLTLERKKFAIKRNWTLLDGKGEFLASFEEFSLFKSILRKILGHAWGMLRASYNVKGVLDSSGIIKNHNTIFNEFTANIDKPQAVDALFMLVSALVINIRDRDLWHPSVN